MLHAFLKKGSFQDSVSLMLISRDLSKADDVNKVSIMMGTPANKDVYRETGMWHELLNEAGPNDICVVIDSDSGEDIVERISERLEEAFANLQKGRKAATFQTVHSFDRAVKNLPGANIALISIAGMYAHEPAMKALESGMHVMMFSDNVSVEREVELKTYGRDHNLLVMGPDCGTSIVKSTPLAFANKMPKGPVGIVGASGTGIQELCSQLALKNTGITHALGLGGRDLSAKVGGISALMALGFLDKDPETKVIAFVSKPPAPEVRAKVSEAMKKLSKPVVALFLGKSPEVRQDGNVYYAYTLDEAAVLAAQLAKVEELRACLPDVSGRNILGLFTGGTLASETAMLLSDAMGLPQDHEHAAGYMLHADGNAVIDLGDDVYTRGRPHPMIDPSVRTERIDPLDKTPEVGVLMMDVVLGFGSNSDPSGAVAESVSALSAKRKEPLIVIATVTGTEEDPQVRSEQIKKLVDAGIIIVDSPREAVMLATRLVEKKACCGACADLPSIFTNEPKVINIGLRDFAQDMQTSGASCIHYQWAPSCQGDERLQKLLKLMK